ncbi:hypothetical protein ACI76O_05475 [Capnocytophaga cynodegmi]|uniref:hypothetical protein n=1 Tax=Capnocytophaga cynodegmi TaxID=28189 RepID=UPI00385C5771
MKHLESYAREIEEALKNIVGIKNILNYNTNFAIHFSFWFDDYEVFNEIEENLPPNWYVSFTQRDKIVVLKYNISQEQNEFLAEQYLLKKQK